MRATKEVSFNGTSPPEKFILAASLAEQEEKGTAASTTSENSNPSSFPLLKIWHHEKACHMSQWTKCIFIRHSSHSVLETFSSYMQVEVDPPLCTVRLRPHPTWVVANWFNPFEYPSTMVTPSFEGNSTHILVLRLGDRGNFKRCLRYGVLKYGYPQIIHFNQIFNYKPTILGVPPFMETPILVKCPIFCTFFLRVSPSVAGMQVSPSPRLHKCIEATFPNLGRPSWSMATLRYPTKTN